MPLLELLGSNSDEPSQVEVSTYTFLRLQIGQIGSWKTRGFRMVRILGFGELVSDSQSDGMHYAFDPSSGGKIFCRLCNSLS